MRLLPAHWMPFAASKCTNRIVGQTGSVRASTPSFSAHHALLVVTATASLLVSGCASCSSCGDASGCTVATGPGIPIPLSQRRMDSACDTNASCNSGGGNVQMCAATCDVPRELRKTTLPTYVIEPPDVLLIEAVNNIRPVHAPVHAGESLVIQVRGTLPYGAQDDAVSRQFKQINGIYIIGTDGYLNLGPEYGKVLVENQPLPEIQRRVETHLQQILQQPQVLVTLPAPQNKQFVSGQHLVHPDGTVHLGVYGSVYVTGLTLDQAKAAVERHLSSHIHRPEVSVDVLAYNSKVYYVVTDGGGAGEQVVRLPSMGNETVLDAISNIRGLPVVASKSDIWIARPQPHAGHPDQILPVDWDAIVRGGQTTTNYQLLPGDRLYVKADPLIAFDTAIAKITAPFERLLGFTILGNGTVRTLQRGRNTEGGGF